VVAFFSDAVSDEVAVFVRPAAVFFVSGYSPRIREVAVWRSEVVSVVPFAFVNSREESFTLFGVEAADVEAAAFCRSAAWAIAAFRASE